MQIGIVHFMAFPEVMKGEGPIVETLDRLCGDDYFQVLEVTTIKDAAVRRAAIEVVRAVGRTVAFGAQPVILANKLDLNAVEPAARQAALDGVRAALAEAVEWQATGFAVMSGPDPDGEDRALAESMLVASLKEICEHSRRAGGPPVVLETFDRVAFGKNCLIGPTAEATAIACQVAPFCDGFGLLIDLSHLPLLGEGADEAVKAASPFLRHVHIGNCVMKHSDHPAYGDSHPVFGIDEGENGVEQLAAFLKQLIEVGYIGEGRRNVVSFEIKPFGDQTSDDVIANAKETLDAAWAAV